MSERPIVRRAAQSSEIERVAMGPKLVDTDRS